MTSFKVILVLGFLAVVATLGVALTPPHLDFTFHPRTSIKSETGQVTLDELDLTSEPGELNSFGDLQRFYDRQAQIYKVISAPEIRVLSVDPDVVLTPRPKKILDLPLLFWIQIVVGLGIFLISGWVWCLRKQDLPSSLFLGGGLSLLIAAFASAIYTSRELALPKELFEIIGTLNAWGGGIFGCIIITLFLVHPTRVPFWITIALVQTLLFGTWVALYTFRIMWANVNFSLVLQMFCICLVVGYQLWASRGNSEARGALTWLGMSIIFGGGAFVVFNTIPVLLKITPLNQGYSFVFLLFIYLGIAAGLTQFELFKVRRWVFYLCFYSFGAVAFVLLYVGFNLVFKIEPWPAVGLALLLLVILYLPLGDSFWRSLHKKD